jgi:hypothetical protein
LGFEPFVSARGNGHTRQKNQPAKHLLDPVALGQHLVAYRLKTTA